MFECEQILNEERKGVGVVLSALHGNPVSRPDSGVDEVVLHAALLFAEFGGDYAVFEPADAERFAIAGGAVGLFQELLLRADVDFHDNESFARVDVLCGVSVCRLDWRVCLELVGPEKEVYSVFVSRVCGLLSAAVLPGDVYSAGV